MAVKGRENGTSEPRARVDILAFGAHADDVELCCGGTLAEAVRRGQSFGIVDLTHAEMGTRGDAETRYAESKKAAQTLGATFRERLDFGDGNLARGREQELAIIRIIRRWRPSVVLAPYWEDRHPDHGRAGRLVADAWFYAGLAKIDTGQPPHRPNVVAHYLQHYLADPTFIVDVSASHDRKMKAIRAYASQFHKPGSREPRTVLARETFLPMIEARARHYGWMIGAEFGEPFVTRQPPRVDDLLAAFHGREIS